MKPISVFNLLIFNAIIVQVVAAMEARIVGGSRVPEGRYDYMTSLQKEYDKISHHCGGTLLSSDIVLTSAHCTKGVRVIIGPYSLDDPRMESIDIERSIPHPLYQNITRKNHDVRILKLKEESSYPYIRLNNAQNIPVSNQELRSVGRGKLKIDDRLVPDYLSFVDVFYRTSGKCARGIYEYDITPDTMCAIGKNNSGTCRGDSGGPLIIPGASSQTDIQVGIVSFSSVNCVHVLYPDVYHRISYTYEWIRDKICAYSRSPPTHYDCDNDGILYSAAPTQDPYSGMPSTSPAPTFDNAPILVEMKVGGKPWSITWYIMSEESSSSPLFNFDRSEFTSRFKIYLTEVDVLRPETNYYFEIFDFAQDGITGEVTIYLGTEPDDDKILAYSNLEDLGQFRRHRVEFVTSPDTFITRLSAAPAEVNSLAPIPPTITLSPAIQSTVIMVQVGIYSCSISTGWRVESVDGQIMFEKPVGSYVNDDMLHYYYSIDVEEGGDYNLVVTSFAPSGFHGEIIVFIGDELAESSIIAYHFGDTGSNFCLSGNSGLNDIVNFRASVDETFGIFPTQTPIVSDFLTSMNPSISPSINPKALELIRIKLLFYPQKVGWWVKDQFNGIVFGVTNEEHDGTQSLSIDSQRLEVDYGEKYYFFLNGTCGSCEGLVEVYIGTESAEESLIGKFETGADVFTVHHEFAFLVENSGALSIFPYVAPTLQPTSESRSDSGKSNMILRPTSGGDFLRITSMPATIISLAIVFLV